MKTTWSLIGVIYVCAYATLAHVQLYITFNSVKNRISKGNRVGGGGRVYYLGCKIIKNIDSPPCSILNHKLPDPGHIQTGAGTGTLSCRKNFFFAFAFFN